MNTQISKITDFLRSLLHKGFLHLLFSNAFMYFLGFLAQLYVAWKLPPDDIGRIRFLQVFGMAANIIAGFGMNAAVQKLCSENRDPGQKAYLYKSAFRFTAIFSLAVYVLAVVLSPFGLFSNDPQVNAIIPLFALSIIPYAVNTLSMAYLEALKRVKSLSRLQAFTKFLNLLFLVGFTQFMLLRGYVIGYVAGFIVTAVVFAMQIRAYNAQFKTVVVEKPFRYQFPVAKYSLLINFLNLLNLYIDIIFINYLAPSRSEIGYYSFASTLLVALYLVTTTIQQITTPYFSERGTDPAEWNRIFRKYSVYNFLASAVLLIAAVLAGPPVIKLLFHGKYDASIIFFIMLSVGWFFRNNYTLEVVALFGSGLIRYNFFSFLAGTIINITVSFFLIRSFGVPGAGYSNMLGGIIYLIVIRSVFVFARRAFLRREQTS
jgi:O-antigen/teichoic acid export membrane protein